MKRASIASIAVAVAMGFVGSAVAQERRIDINKIGGNANRTVIPNSVADRSRGLQYEQRAGDEQKAARQLQNQARTEARQGNSMAAKADLARANVQMQKARTDMAIGQGLVAKSKRER